jgi:hypothetical protein
MKKILFLSLFLSVIIVSWCGSSKDTIEYDDIPYTNTDTIEEISKPTVTTEIPENTNEEIITQADTSL